MGNLESDIRSLLNSHNAECFSNTPDYILARYLMACLDAFNAATVARDQHNGQSASPGTGEGAT